VRKGLKTAARVLVSAIVAAQLVRPDRANPVTDPACSIQAQTRELGAILDRSCRDCHSNKTVWPWYANLAPASWLMAHGVKKGRRAVNFSEWAAYRPEKQLALLAASCEDVRAGRMPGPWTLLHPEAKLSPSDVQTICAAAGRADAAVAGGL
jgi:hypothetical protein